jgi:hypothetical protein
VKLYGKVLGGIREFSSSANCVLDAVEDLYLKFRSAPEAQSGKIPIVELTKTIPISMGKGSRASTAYIPCFVIVGWTGRGPEMGERTVPIPPAPPTAGTSRLESSDAAPPTQTPAPIVSGTDSDDLDDEIPF